MKTIREIIQRDLGVKIEGVVKVFDRSTLASEIREYVVTDKIEEELKRIFDTFTLVSDTLRRGGNPRDVMGIWVSGFFGSGKSHFAKVLGYLLQNDILEEGSEDRCIDVFIKHLSDSPRGKDTRLRLGEIKQTTDIRTIAFEIKSRQSLNNPNSVGEILLSEFYRNIGLAENFIVARIERRLQRHGLFDKLEQAYETKFGAPWKGPEGRDDLMTVRRRLAEILPEIDPSEYQDKKEAKSALTDMFRHAQITAEGIADELVAWVDDQKTKGGKVKHLVFVIDEMGGFIGDSQDKIGELNALAEMIGNKGKGKVWIIATSQQDLESVVDLTNFQPALVGRLNARFELKPHLISDEINKVVSERILKKYPSQEGELKSIYKTNEGRIANLSDIKASRHLGNLDERNFKDCYPFFPHQIRLSQDVFEALSGFRISGGVRSMISVIMETLQDLADEEIGVMASFDQVFDAVENDLLSQEYLGASGVRAIRESHERVPGAPMAPDRVLKVLWLLQRVAWVPRVPETVAKLLIQNINGDIVQIRSQVEQTLHSLQDSGYVARDEATGEWKFLNERERTIEQAIQEMVRPGGSKSITIAAIRRISQEISKSDVISKKKLNNFMVAYGKTKVPFGFCIYLDGEAVDTGAELEAHFVSPLASGRKQSIEDIRQQNQAAGIKGRTVWWVADVPAQLENRFKRYEALVKVTGDRRFTEDSSKDTQDALSEKRKERDELKGVLVHDMERAYANGTTFSAGQETQLDDSPDIKQALSNAITALIPHVYSRFKLADVGFDFFKNLKALLNPATRDLNNIIPDLDLFDSQGNLHRESAIVEQVLEVIGDLADEDIDPTGAILIDARDNKGFKGFSRSPFGWPDEHVQLVLAACLRAGAIYMEVQTSAGPRPVYEYHDAADAFLKINTFKKLIFRVAETSLSVDQIKEAIKALIHMGVSGTPESGNAIAATVRRLGEKLMTGMEEAESHAKQGLPIQDTITGAAQSLVEPTTLKDPTAAVIAFLKEKDAWIELNKSILGLKNFLDANRHQEFLISLRITDLVNHHPMAGDHPLAVSVDNVLADMAALRSDKSVIDRWPDYRNAFEKCWQGYRSAYLELYNRARNEAQATIAKIKSGDSYSNAPIQERDDVVEKIFGDGKACHYPEITIPTASALIDAAARNSLTALEQSLVALPGYQSQVENALRDLVEPPPPSEQVWEWRASVQLPGRRLKTTEEVDTFFNEISTELKARIKQGLTVVIK